jgi:transposase
VLVQLKDILKEKRHGNITKLILFLYDNAPAHRMIATQKKLAYLDFQYHYHPPYSQDMAPTRVTWTEKKLKGHHFWSNTDVIAAV